jgi:hypothetical protein
MTRAIRVLMCSALVALTVVTAVPAQADSVGGIKEFGWWTKRPGAQPTPNGFEVANGPDGVESVAAFRVALTGSVTQGTLEFTESTDANVAKVSGTPALEVCATTSSWTAEQQGAFDKAPKPDCSVSVKMQVDDKGSWAADVTPLLAGKTGEVSLMALPDVQPTAGLVQPTFNRQFGAPVATTEGTPGPPSTSYSSSPSYLSTTADRTELPAAQVFPTPPLAPVPLNSNGTVNASPSVPTPTTQANVVTPQGITIGAAHAAHKEWGRLVLYVPLAGIIGVAFVVGRKTLVARGLLPSA